MPQTTDNIFVLRLFGVFGKYEAWDVRFISNACARVVRGLPIVIRQNVGSTIFMFPNLRSYSRGFSNTSPGRKLITYAAARLITLLELAEMVAAASGRDPEIIVRNPAMGPEYSADNTRMLREIGGFRFRPMSDCIGELYHWYKAHAENISVDQLTFDDSE